MISHQTSVIAIVSGSTVNDFELVSANSNIYPVAVYSTILLIVIIPVATVTVVAGEEAVKTGLPAYVTNKFIEEDSIVSLLFVNVYGIVNVKFVTEFGIPLKISRAPMDCCNGEKV